MNIIRPIIIALIAWFIAAPASAQDDMASLLEQIRQSAREARTFNAEREQRFLREKNRQAARLAEARKQRDAARQRANTARSAFTSGQKEIEQLEKQLKEKLGDSAELYAAVSESAGELRDQLQGSVLLVGDTDALDELSLLAQAGEIPDGVQIEGLILRLMETAARSGRTETLETELVRADGQSEKAQVLRVGAFSIVTADGYATVHPEDSELVELSRQPGGLVPSLKTDGLQSVWIDPSGGELMRRVAQRPTLMDRVHQGGEVGYIIIAIGVIGALLAIWQFFYLVGVGRRVRRQLRNIDQPKSDNPLGRVLNCFADAPGERDPEVLETRLSEAVLRETPKLERFQAALRMIIAAGPLLGLLGTVVGMIITFQVITEVGAGDPRLMAGGISRAMIATVLGLGIAVPLLFINSFLMSRSRVLTQILDEQAAGLLVRELERDHDQAPA